MEVPRNLHTAGGLRSRIVQQDRTRARRPTRTGLRSGRTRVRGIPAGTGSPQSCKRNENIQILTRNVREHRGEMLYARAHAEVAARVSVVAGLKVTVATEEAGVARAVVVELVVVAATAARARLVPAPVVCKATSILTVTRI